MLTDTINSSISAIQQKRDAQQRKQSIDLYKSALLKLDKSTKQLVSLLDIIDALSNCGMTSEKPLDASTVQDLKDLIDRCGQGLHDGSLSSDIVNSLSTQIQTVKVSLDSFWKECAPNYGGGTKGYLSMIASLTDDPRKVRALSATIDKEISSTPTVNVIYSLVLNVGAANKIIHEYSLQPSIETFLKKVSSNSATLADVTPTVREWLKEKKLMGKLKVTF